jgi:hypothetical protein
MNGSLFYLCGNLALALPFVAIAAILIHYFLLRAVWKWKNRQGKTHSGFCPSAAALGTIFLFAQVFYRPAVFYVLEARQVEKVPEDEDGNPETIAKQLNRQLRRIRRGEPLDRLVLRL